MRRFAFLFCYFVFLSCAPSLPVESLFHDETTSPFSETGTVFSPLKIEILDVGQGDATLVIGPFGKTILIDAGAEEADIGDRYIKPLMAGKDLDWIIASHYDADHIGGLPSLLAGGEIPLQGILDRGDETDKSTVIFSSYLQEAGLYRQEAEPGMTLDLGDSAKATVVVVNGNYSDGRSIHLNPDEENEACIGLLIQYGDFKYFTAGDLTGGGAPGGYETKDMETWAGEIIGDIDLLHLGHHGSSSSTNQNFLDRIQPEAAVISVGQDNDYGHPTKEILDRLDEAGIAVYRTDLLGSLQIESDGTGFKIDSLSVP